MKSIKKLFILLVIIALIIAVLSYFRDMDPPEVSLSQQSGPISANSDLELTLRDESSGLRSVKIIAMQKEHQITLLQREFPPDTTKIRIPLELKSKKLREGELTIEVYASDLSIYHFGGGNKVTTRFELTFDNRAPVISVISRAHNFRHGGAGLVRYHLNETVVTSGVQVDKNFFPGFQQPSGDYVALVAWPWSLPQEKFVPRIQARDLAGNERNAGIYFHTIERKFRKRRINLSDKFLQQKAPEFEPLAPGLSDPLEIYLKINGDVRKANREKIAQLAKETANAPLWQGRFIRQPNTVSLALFADQRDYLYQGKVVDHATHLGYDLASVARAKVLAANSGRVVFAGYLGIYGQCVVIDHGLGLQTLYAHMSQLNVAVGDPVETKQIIGRTGATGMAGGDHLHFGIFIAGVAVQPREWWDARWLKNNIGSKLDQKAGRE